MTTRIAFLRAVNLGRRRVENSRLVELVGGLGLDDVWAYIGSGNIVFSGPGRRVDLERSIGDTLEAAYGFEVTTFVRTAAELATALRQEPFEVSDGDTYFITFLGTVPTVAQATALEALSNDFDTLVVRGRDVHWHMSGRSTDSRLAKRDWERILGGNTSTSRNTTMLRKLAAKIADRR